MNHSQAEKWRKQRSVGAFTWILTRGVLFFGTMMFGLALYQRWPLEFPRDSSTLVFLTALHTSLGAVWGWLMWRITEAKYKRFLEETAAAS